MPQQNFCGSPIINARRKLYGGCHKPFYISAIRHVTESRVKTVDSAPDHIHLLLVPPPASHPMATGGGHPRDSFYSFRPQNFSEIFFAPISSVKQVDMSPFFSYTCAVVQGLLCLVVKGKSSAPEHRTTERGCWKSGRNGAPAPQSRVKPLRCKQMQFTPRGEASLRST